MVRTRPELAQGDNLGILKRKWEYMYIYAEIGFARAYTSMHIFTFVRPVSSIMHLLLVEIVRYIEKQENIVALCH